MKRGDEEILLRDLCARLPYKVKVYGNYRYSNGDEIIDDKKIEVIDLSALDWFVNGIDIKPYLRPMSSMTDEERHEIQEILGEDVEIPDDFINIIDSSRKSFSFIELQAVFDYFNAHYLDYRGLIEKGLALPVPEGMYNEIKEK